MSDGFRDWFNKSTNIQLRSSGSSFKTLIIYPFYPSQFVVAKDFFLSAKFNLKITLDLEVTLRTIFQIVLI